jgi:hypothetical protein
MTRARGGVKLRMVLLLMPLTAELGMISAHALVLGYACQADADTVFGVASKTAQDMPY